MHSSTAPQSKKVLAFLLAVVSIFALLAFILRRTAQEAARSVSRSHIDVSNLETEALVGKDYLRVEMMRKARTAASQGDIATVSEMLEQGFSIDQDVGQHTTLLMVAAQNNQSKMVRFLVQHHAKIDLQNIDHKNALIFAAEAGNVEEVLYLLSQDKKADINKKYSFMSYYNSSIPNSEFQRTLLWIAAEKGNLPLVRALVHHHANVNARDKVNGTALTYAASAGSTDIVKFLVSQKADVNVGNDSDHTPLAYARMNHHNDIVKFLEEAGARR